jgi:DNA invertase Pin-like site-specific DNA recombinase
VSGAVAVVLALLVIAAGGTPLTVAVRGRLRKRPSRDVDPVNFRPLIAELALARPAKERATRRALGGDSGRSAAAPLPAVAAARGPGPMFGYASWDGRNGKHASAFRGQAEQIASECHRLEATLLELVREREPQRGRALERPGLGYALQSISAGEARGLVVADLSRLTRSAAELGRLLQWLLDHDARFIAIAQGLDTDEESGRVAVRTIIEVSRWEHDRLVERTRNGMLAARRTGPPRVADYPQLKERIVQMRAQGMTLQAIAGQLNREGTPTIRGGAKWRPSSVQVAAGYRRPPAGHRNHSHSNGAGINSSNGKA